MTGPQHLPRRSFTPSFVCRGRDFPSLADSTRIKETRCGTRDRNLNSVAMARDSPFAKVADHSMLLKFTPIEFRWPSRRSRIVDAEFRQRAKMNGGQLWNSRWFRSPPKVRVVLGILGPCPGQGTRDMHRQGGK